VTDNERLTKNERREAAREKARLLREEQKKKERRTRVLLQGGIALAAVAIIAVVGLIIWQSVRPAGPGPANMASDGIQISQGAIATETPALASDDDPVPTEREDGVLDIRMYVDYFCPICNVFEQTNGEYITGLMENGDTTVEIHPIAILDRLSQGSRYSTRATNAAACVAEYSPNQYYDWHNLMFQNQPAENTSGLSDDELIGITEQASVENADDVASCIRDQQFRGWVSASTARALNGPLPDADVENVEGTPTIIVNGVKYNGPVDDLTSFQTFVVQQAGSEFVEETESTPTPTPTPAG
jgi:protein-disulfide isomerase